ncbi:MAG: hypothetical protein WCD79_11175 [Chthoniobacteraceae bacterium]
MSHIPDFFPDRVHDKLFETQEGDLCLCLDEDWPALLASLGQLGPVTLISRSTQMSLLSSSQQLDFAPVPGSTEILDLHSSLCLETGALGPVIARYDRQTGRPGIHFYDREGKVILQVMLPPDGDPEGFVQLVGLYAKELLSTGNGPGFRSARSQMTAHHSTTLPADEMDGLHEAWPSFDPASGGDLLPGTRGVGWLHALRMAGGGRALFLTKSGMIKAALAAYYGLIPLRITAWTGGLYHQAGVLPRRMERCAKCVHLLDIGSGFHFLFGAEMEIWAGFHGRNSVPAIHIFSTEGHRHGLLEFAGQPHERDAWNRAVREAAGITRNVL